MAPFDELQRAIKAVTQARVSVLIVTGGWNPGFDAAADVLAKLTHGRHVIVPSPNRFVQLANVPDFDRGGLLVHARGRPRPQGAASGKPQPGSAQPAHGAGGLTPGSPAPRHAHAPARSSHGAARQRPRTPRAHSMQRNRLGTMGHTYTGRREDQRLVTGAGRYTADCDQPGQLHAVFVRADRAHADILGLDASAARSAPGVVAVLTAADMAEAGYMRGQAQVPFKGRGEALKSPASPALAQGRVRYVGEPVAVVVAGTAHSAQDAAELVVVEYRDLPAVVDGRAALEPGAPLLHGAVLGNLCFDFEYGDAAATEAAFASAAHVVRLRQDSGRVVGNPMEPKAALAAWDGDVLDLWSGSQGVTGMRDGMAGLTGLAPGRIRAHAQDVGGAFGIRGAAYPEYAALALAARVAGRPVKWVASRSETFLRRLPRPGRADVGGAGAGCRGPVPGDPP